MSKQEDYDLSEDCDEVCPECMSRRVATLDGLTREYECLNCGHTWFVELKQPDIEEKI